MERSSVITFGEWLPDQEALNSRGTTFAKNVIPMLSGYRSFKQLAPVSNAATNELLGMFAGKDDESSAQIYAGDAGKLYEFSPGTLAMTDLSKSGGYNTLGSNKWNFSQFGEKVLATNYDDNIQIATVADSTAFADLGGTPPRAHFITVVRDQVMVANTYDSTDLEKPYRIWWSGLNDETSWTPGTNLSDYQDISDIGHCTGLVGGEYAIALFEKAIVRGVFTGYPTVYEFSKLTTAKGCTVPGSVAAVGSSQVFWFGDDGFYMLQGNEIKAIGAEKINRWFLDRLNVSYKQNMSAGVDPRSQNVIWSFPSTSSADGSNDEILIYNYTLDRWSYAEENCTAVAPLFTAGYTLEELDAYGGLDNLPAPLDDAIWQGGAFFFAGAKDKKIQSFTGASLDATVDTGEFQVAPGRRSVVNLVIPYITSNSGQSQTVTAKVGSRSRQVDQPTFTSASSLTSDGYCPVRSNGAFHRVRVDITGEWNLAMGVDVDSKQQGLR